MAKYVLATMLAGALATTGAAAQTTTAPSVREVTPARLAAAETDAENWLGYGRDLGAHRYGPSTSINRDNVHQLGLAWTQSLGTPVSLEGTPVENDGVLYVTTGKSTVFAFDAKTGKQLWKYVYPLPPTASAEACCNTNNRGATLYKDMVITGTLDAHLVALDAKTGAVRWNTTVAPSAQGYSITSPPLAVNGNLVTGVAGGEYGIRGFVAAYNGDTGKLAWRTYTVPAAGEPTSETWKVPGSLERPGGSTWMQGTFDSQLNTVYWGVGNPTPLWDPHANSGSLLYTDSLLALDATTGKLKWHHQYNSHDIWDFDGTNEPTIVDVPIDGNTVKAVVIASRNGFAYLLNRETGKTIWAVPFVDRVNWGTVDPKTGVATTDATMQATALAMKPYLLCPNSFGGKNWEPTAYDPTQNLLFIPVIEGCDTISPAKTKFKRGTMDLGGLPRAAKDSQHGSVAAIDLATGKIVWKTHFRSPQDGGALVTAGGLVFSSDPEGILRALDETTGKVLWQSPKTKSALNAPPITYSISGTQYIAVLSGTGGAWPLYYPASTPWLNAVPNGAQLYVYALGPHLVGQH